MFQEGNYDTLRLPIPKNGMNQFVSPEILPQNFAFYLENILPTPLGSGQVRFGTRPIGDLEDATSNIIKGFRFVKDDGNEQIVLYVRSYTEDEDISDAEVVNQTSLTFTSSENAERYIVDTYISISYTLNGSNYTFYPQIKEVTVTEYTDVEITLGQSFFPAAEDIEIQSISYSVGQIYVYDFESEEFSDVLKDGLSVACIPRKAFFQQKLLIYNGVDKLLSWDGEDLEEVVDYVKETKAQVFNYIDENNFSFASLPGFDADKYFDGNFINLVINGLTTELTISNVAVADTLVTITTVEEVPEFEGVIELFYQDWPPTFNYIYAGTDRLWALGTGPAGIKWRESDQALRAYYTFLPNTITGWFNENTKTVPSINLADKHGIQDNLEAICQVNGLTAFVGRSRTQVWSGSIPPPYPGAPGDFIWQSNLDVGVVHGDLLISLDNDTYFVSPTGLKSASTLNVAKQFAASSSNAVDPIIEKYLSDIMGSDIDYRACRSFKYEQGGFGGFKIGRNKILVSLFEVNFYAWSMFSGDFQRSNDFLDANDSLYLFIGNGIHQYADGNDGSGTLYGDNNGESLISFSWIPGLLSWNKRSSRRFANKRYELILKYPSSFADNDLNKVSITINGQSPSTFQVSDECVFDDKGDTLGTAPFGQFKLGVNYSFINQKLKFVSSGFWVRLNGYTTNGPLELKELKLFGIGERNG
jgi:hypothetical protein